MRVLFVCTGNTCRSPLAQAYSSSKFPGLSFLSAGLAARPGVPASKPAQVVARRHGLDLSQHESRGLDDIREPEFDQVFGMTEAHCRKLEQVRPEWKVFCLGEFLSDGHEIPDPFGGDEQLYESCFAQLSQALTKACQEFGWTVP